MAAEFRLDNHVLVGGVRHDEVTRRSHRGVDLGRHTSECVRQPLLVTDRLACERRIAVFAASNDPCARSGLVSAVSPLLLMIPTGCRRPWRGAVRPAVDPEQARAGTWPRSGRASSVGAPLTGARIQFPRLGGVVERQTGWRIGGEVVGALALPSPRDRCQRP